MSYQYEKRGVSGFILGHGTADRWTDNGSVALANFCQKFDYAVGL